MCKAPERLVPTRMPAIESFMSADTTDFDADLSPAERRRLKVRDSIIAAAEEIFAEEGEAGLSMRRIAERIDYSPAALYKYFDSKEALCDEIREQFFERLLGRLRAVTEKISEGPRLSEDCLRAYVQTGLEQPSHYRLAFSGIIRHEELRSDSFAFAAATHLEDRIRESMDAGWFEAGDSALAASSVCALSHGITMLAVTIPEYPQSKPGSGHLTLDDVIAFEAKILLKGLGTDKLRQRLAEKQEK